MKIIILVILFFSINLIYAETTFFDKPDSFFIINNPSAENIIEGTGGTGTGKIINMPGGPCRYAWNCTKWSLCFSEKQIRDCINIGSCLDSYKPPETEKNCTSDIRGIIFWRDIKEDNRWIIYILSFLTLIFIISFFKKRKNSR